MIFEDMLTYTRIRARRNAAEGTLPMYVNSRRVHVFLRYTLTVLKTLSCGKTHWHQIWKVGSWIPTY